MLNARELAGRKAPVVSSAFVDGELWVGVGVDEDVEVLLVESALPAPRRYRPGEGFTGASEEMLNDRSGTDMERVNEDDNASTADFLAPLSSFAGNDGAASERFDEPDVDTVESDDEDGYVGWPSRVAFVDWACSRVCWLGADEDRFSCRSWGVLEKA
jgi:hypothetical protein